MEIHEFPTTQSLYKHFKETPTPISLLLALCFEVPICYSCTKENNFFHIIKLEFYIYISTSFKIIWNSNSLAQSFYRLQLT